MRKIHKENKKFRDPFHWFSPNFFTNHLTHGTSGSLTRQLCDTFVSDCLNFLHFFPIFLLAIAATWKTFSSFARKIENEKLFSNRAKRLEDFSRENFSRTYTREKLTSRTGNSLREISPVVDCMSFDPCALPSALCLFWFSLITPQVSSLDGNHPKHWKNCRDILRKLFVIGSRHFTESHDVSVLFTLNKRRRTIYQSIENWNVGLSDALWRHANHAYRDHRMATLCLSVRCKKHKIY